MCCWARQPEHCSGKGRRRVVFQRVEISDDKLARLNVLRTDQDREDFDRAAKHYLNDLVARPKSAAEIRSEAIELTQRVSRLKAELGVKETPEG